MNQPFFQPQHILNLCDASHVFFVDSETHRRYLKANVWKIRVTNMDLESLAPVQDMRENCSTDNNFGVLAYVCVHVSPRDIDARSVESLQTEKTHHSGCLVKKYKLHLVRLWRYVHFLAHSGEQM